MNLISQHTIRSVNGLVESHRAATFEVCRVYPW